MKLIFRILAILAVALIVVGAAVALAGSSGSGGTNGFSRGGFDRQGAPGVFGGARPDGDFGGGFDGAVSTFALTTVLKNAAIAGWIGLMGVLALRGVKALRGRFQRRRQAQAGSTPGA